MITRARVEGSAPFVCTWLGLQALATAGHVSASTQNQALSAPIFLYEVVLRVPLDRLADLVPARRPTRITVVLSRDEVDALGRLRGSVWLMYGAGLRIMECAELRVKDVDIPACETARGGRIA